MLKSLKNLQKYLTKIFAITLYILYKEQYVTRGSEAYGDLKKPHKVNILVIEPMHINDLTYR